MQMRKTCEEQNGFKVSCLSSCPNPVQTKSVGTIAASTNCCLLSTTALCSTWHYTVLMLLYRVSYEQNRSYEKMRGFALTSDLQQQRSSIMMHSCGHPAARRQRCSHAPIPCRQPRSVCTSTWSLSRACYVRACCVRIVMRSAGRKSLIMTFSRTENHVSLGNCARLTALFFVE